MSPRKNDTDIDSLHHPRCPALGGPVPFRHCRTSGTDLTCHRIPECWWNNPLVIHWYETATNETPPRKSASRLQTILKTLDDAHRPRS
jgi:hypothetical protein